MTETRSLKDLADARDSYARILARLVVEGADPDDHFYRVSKAEFARLDALLS